ncbi:MAG: hypothetical protein AB7U76_24960 [Pirellulales bacterium]
MSKKKQVEAEIFDEIRLKVTCEELAACIARHEAALATAIRDTGHPVMDGTVINLISTLKALRGQIICSDDPAGRGLGADAFEGDIEE